ncbi:hypothetical protein DUNSADRAFT_3935 [Dunaliella salina]|uniref:Encoded protein n=1 Tax=Dunaliella salina TaxID=3046 RepID=A0ABQ7H7T5_DUNSA|nr:hypothetical protein DUNSADRAFT_3935 [Dunaliella salina]|eukprot:KAF5842908.1 hypothetical protein DUNSADRAFT_3935 [Dunaliella salina]
MPPPNIFKNPFQILFDSTDTPSGASTSMPLLPYLILLNTPECSYLILLNTPDTLKNCLPGTVENAFLLP